MDFEEDKMNKKRIINVFCGLFIGFFLYNIFAELPKLIKNNTDRNLFFDDINQISDEQLLYFAINHLTIDDIQPGASYIKINRGMLSRGTVIYTEKKKNGISQYSYAYDSSGDYGSSIYLILRKDNFVYTDDTTSNQYYVMDDNFLVYNENGSISEIKRVYIPDDWSIRNEEAVNKRHIYNMVLIRLIAIFLFFLGVTFTYTKKQIKLGCNYVYVPIAFLLSAFISLIVRGIVYIKWQIGEFFFPGSEYGILRQTGDFIYYIIYRLKHDWWCTAMIIVMIILCLYILKKHHSTGKFSL